MKQTIVTIWKPTKANGGSCENIRVEKIGGGYAATLCARYYKGISQHGCNAVLVADDNVMDELLIKEATKQGYKCAIGGDSVNLGQPNSTTRRGRVGHGVANTLTTQNEMGVVETDLRIRKLTPKECWRLQGFPDEYFDGAKAAGVSDSQLYKQAGNGVSVNISYAIGLRLKQIEEEYK